MSGVTGGDRILKKDILNITNSYINILKKFPKFITYEISGSLASSKMDCGDIDLIIQFNDNDKKNLKADLIKFLMKLPSNIILPFKNNKYKNKRYYNSGEIITILFPQNSTKCVQIDNIIALSTEELFFKKNFLNLPAEKQGLILGLMKTILIENTTSDLIKEIPKLTKNQELEFNLSSSSLELRKMTLGNNYKILKKEVIWKSTNWDDVKHLLANYQIDSSFEDLLTDIKSKLKHKRSFNRIIGLFNSMVSVKSGEIGTPKGEKKQKAKKMVTKLLNQ